MVKRNRVEVKTVDKSFSLKLGRAAVAGLTDDPDDATSFRYCDVVNPFNKWMHIGFNPLANANPNTWLSTVADVVSLKTAEHKITTQHNEYKNTLGMTIPQGTSYISRVGRDINVISDKWKFHLYFPSYYRPNMDIATGTDPSHSYGAAERYWSSSFLSHRPFTVRLIGIFQNTLPVAGAAGFTPQQLFKDVNDMRSWMNTDDAKGYSIIYDKTKRMTGNRSPISVTGTTGPTTTTIASHGPAFNSSGPSTDIYFSKKLSYLRRYTDTNSDGVEIPETITDVVDTNLSGVTKGFVSWYIFVQDFNGASNTSNATGHVAPPADPRAYPKGGITVSVQRKFKYTDA